jgi:uncharacterized protein YbgA (DUF1722 family)/uncharacterized protein YbbK (DUF523 family)
MSREAPAKIRIGISSCLLGEKVRFDGGHKLDTLITETLGKHFEWIPVCPEMEIGLGTPRETLRLIGAGDAPRLVAMKSGTDLTDKMAEWAAKRLEQLAQLNLRGYILKKDSPSCGMERVRIYQENGIARRGGSGIYAAMLGRRFAMLPIEEEGRLHDAGLRENFIERIFAHQRWLAFLDGRPGAGDLVRFHAGHKLTLASHSDPHYRELGRLAAAAGKRKMAGVLEEYGRMFMDALRVRATVCKHANVLYHILGYFKKDLNAANKEEMVITIESYRKGFLPLIVPLTLVAHHLRHHPVPWICEQTYLNPYPAELMLRNHL